MKIANMNVKRAGWAEAAVMTFARKTGQDKSGDDMETILADLLADVMHLVAREKLKFDDVLVRAKAHYREETRHSCRVCREKFDPESELRPCDGRTCPECYEGAE